MIEEVKKRHTETSVPPMPEGFKDATAWRAIHFQLRRTQQGHLSQLSAAMMQWRFENQDRCRAAFDAALRQEEAKP